MRVLRTLADSFRVRLVLAIFMVVSMALAIVLIALPRQLDSYFAQQDAQNLKARTDAMATLVGNQIIVVTTLAGNPFPVLQGPPLRASRAVIQALEATGFVRRLTPTVALADVRVDIAPARGEDPVYTLTYSLPDSAGEPGQSREALTHSSSFAVPDVFWTEDPAAAPERLVTVTLSSPFTFREQTVTTLVNVMTGAAIAALGASIVAAVLLAQWLTSPVRRLTQASRALAAGRLDVRVRQSQFGSPELAELAGSFNEMAERLQESIDIISADRDRSRAFVADVSHELRTPIAALRTFNELLRQGAGEDPATREEFLDQCQRQIERLDWLATNLLEQSKLDSGLVSLGLRTDDLRAVVESAAQQAQPVADRKGIDLVIDLPADPVRQPHDPPRIGQVLTNLIGNACKFTPAGGRVDVELRATPTGARIVVTDTGMGIPAEELPHVFERFWRGAKRPELRASGSGLGLSIVKSIVDMHEGDVSITSAPDVGTRVIVDLPGDLDGRLAAPTVGVSSSVGTPA
ncbi:MAG: HAMP domain-containing histidine kinase [Chloroflexi bacterium]|nr:HAMP domain-containing histidine kinase [Chloroflexota bacterium]